MRRRGHRTRILRISALSGALGVLSGYAVFLCYREVHGDPAKERSFFIALLLTAVLSYIFEWLRELIREGEVENSRSVTTSSLGTFVVVLVFEVFLAGFHGSAEQMSWEMLRRTAVALLAPAVEGRTADWILAVMAAGWVAVGAMLAAWLSKSVVNSKEPMLRQVFGALRWGLIGGLIVAPVFVAVYVLSARSLVALEGVTTYYAKQSLPFELHRKAVHRKAARGNAPASGTTNQSGTAPSSTAQGNGVKWSVPETTDRTAPHRGALINVPPAVTRFFDRFFALGDKLFTFFRFIALLPVRVGIGLFLIPLFVPFILLILARKVSVWFFWLAFAAELTLLIWDPLSSNDRNAELNKWVERIRWGVLISTVGIFCYAMFEALHPWNALLKAIALAAISWALPGMLLGAFVPLLRPLHPRLWAFIGYGSALTLILATLLRWRSEVLLHPDLSLMANVSWPAKVSVLAALAAALAGLLFDRGISVRDFWPLAALCVAVGMCGATSITQRLTLPREVALLDSIMHSNSSSSAPQETQEERDRIALEVRALELSAGPTPAPSAAAARVNPAGPTPVHKIAEPAQYDEASARELQVAISGSVGFWITVGMLACWSIEELDEEEREESPSKGSP
jgi:hypothetical protein